jgi:ABC-type transport system involved in multi-copper enzyme maturation permease subunit
VTLTIARLTLLELVRRRLVHAILLLTLLAIAVTSWGFAQLPRFLALLPERNEPVDAIALGLIASQLLILVLFMFSFVFALVGVFVAAPAVAGDVESGLVQALLARPIDRVAYVLGRWLGIVVAVSVYVVAVAVVELVVVRFAAGYAPPNPAAGIAFLVLEAISVATLGLVLGTRLPSVTAGVTAGVLFAIAWVAGVVGGIGRAFEDPVLGTLGPATSVVLPSDGLWRAAVYALEPPAILLGAAGAGPQLAAFPFLVTDPVAPTFVVWSLVWIAVVLAVGVAAFRTRDL